MDVAEELVVWARVAVKLTPRSSAVPRQQQRTLLDRDIERVWIARIEHHHLGMRQVRRRRKGPVFRAGHLAQRRQSDPVPAKIAAAEQQRRLRSGIERYAAVLLDRRERIDILRGHALVARLPALAVIRAEKYAVAMGAGEKTGPARNHCERRCVHAGQHGLGETPSLAGCIALQHADATGGGDQEPARRSRAVIAIATIGTQASKHRSDPPRAGSALQNIKLARTSQR